MNKKSSLPSKKIKTSNRAEHEDSLDEEKLNVELYDRCFQDLRKRIECQKLDWANLKKEPVKEKIPPECFKNKNHDEILCDILDSVKRMEKNFDSLFEIIKQMNSRAIIQKASRLMQDSSKTSENLFSPLIEEPSLAMDTVELDIEPTKLSLKDLEPEVKEKTPEQEESCTSEEECDEVCSSGSNSEHKSESERQETLKESSKSESASKGSEIQSITKASNTSDLQSRVKIKGSPIKEVRIIGESDINQREIEPSITNVENAHETADVITERGELHINELEDTFTETEVLSTAVRTSADTLGTKLDAIITKITRSNQ